MRFALRHPDRVTALILMVPAAFAPSPGDAVPKRMTALGGMMMDLLLRSDLLFWLGLRIAPRTMTRMILGTPPALLTDADPVERARVRTALKHVLPDFDCLRTAMFTLCATRS